MSILQKNALIIWYAPLLNIKYFSFLEFLSAQETHFQSVLNINLGVLLYCGLVHNDSRRFNYDLTYSLSNNIQVRETDVHLRQRSYSPLDLKKRIESNEYPPRLDFDVIATDHPQTLVCRLIIKGFSCSEYYKKESFFNITAKVPNVLDTTFNSHSRTRTNEQRNSLMNHHLSRLTDEQKQATFIYDHILKIYQHIKDWKKIGHHLGLPESLIHSIRYSNPNPGRCELSFDVLNAWVRETTAQERTYQIFIQRLIEADEMAAVQSLVNYITE